MTRFDVQPAAGPEQNPYLPKGPPDPLLFEEFEGMNTQTTRPGVDDKQMAWCDGWMPIARRKLRTLPGVGSPITFADGDTVSFFAFANIGATPYCIVIHNDGSVHAVNTSTYVQTLIAPTGTITNPSRLDVGLTQYGSQYVLIVSSQTDGYFLWDGSTFYYPGDPAPSSLVAANWTTQGGSAMNWTTQSGAAMDWLAADEFIPTGISGTAIEIYAGRVWIANGATITFSAPGSVTDFSTASGGGNFTSSDSFLRVRYVQLIQTNGFLYLIADSSINYISGVQTSGTPATTTFTNQNADPEVGSPWPSTVSTFGRSILFANAFGAHVSYGAAVNKISDMLDGVYNTLPNFGGIIPSSAKAIIFGKRVWLLLLAIIDPITGQPVNKIFMWDSKRWWASSQDVTLFYIQNQEIDSVLTAWGTNGTSIYPLFQTPTTGFSKVVQSKLWDKPGGYQFVKLASRLWGILQYADPRSPNLVVNIDNESATDSAAYTVASPVEADWTTQSGAAMNWTTQSGAAMVWQAAGIGVIGPMAIGQTGVLTGLTATTSCADMTIISMMLGEQIGQTRS